MNVRLLIQQAYRWAEILAEDGETASATQLNTGLNLLNKILRQISIDGYEIPLLTSEIVNLVKGSNELNLVGWTKLIKLQYDLGGIKQNIPLVSLNDYRNADSIVTAVGTPYIGYAQRTPTGILLQVFFAASIAYTTYLNGYKTLTNVTIDDSFTDIEEFMADYLELQLARNLQTIYQLKVNPFLAEQLEIYLTKFNRIKPRRIDMVTNKCRDLRDIYDKTPSLNLGRGYTV